MARAESYHPDYRLLPAVLDQKAADDPDGIYASFPKTDVLSDGFRDYSNREVVRAIDAFAWWLDRTYGRSQRFETLSYVGVNDLRYAVFFQACVKAGYKALFFSPRNTVEQNAALIRQTQCTKLFFSEKYKSLAESLRNQKQSEEELTVVGFDPVDEWLAKEHTPYPYTKSYDEACQDPIVVFHSSGSTGPPKTIVQNHQFFINGHRFPPLPTGKRGDFYDIYKFKEQSWMTASFPFYHLAGFTSLCLNPVFYKTCSMVYGFPDRPANAETILKILKLKPVRLINTPPSIIEEMLRFPDAESYLQGLDTIIYAGGPLASWTGDKLSEHVNLVTNYGSTESGPVTMLLPERHNWRWMDFHPAIHLKWDKMFDDVHELVFERDGEADPYRPIGATILPSQGLFRTKDLFVPHPTQQGLWRFYGRNDDIVVFSNGLKWNPLPTEAIITSHPDVTGTLVVGTGMLQPIAVIERAAHVADTSDKDLINSVWPKVRQANQQTQRYGRVKRSNIMLVAPNTFLRTPKGSTTRQATTKLLQNRIDNSSSWSQTDNHERLPDKHITNKQDLVKLVRACVLDELSLGEVDNDADLFAAGLDSLGAIEVSTGIRQTVQSSWPSGGAKTASFPQALTIFAFPTIARLSRCLEHVLLHDRDVSTLAVKSDRDFVAKYRIVGSGKSAPNTSGHDTFSVAVTGSTGSLGSCLVECFARSPSTAKILCLNRSEDAEVRTRKSLPFLPARLWAKVEFRRIEIHETNLGFDRDTVDALQQCDAVLHCAWSVNFLQSIDSLEDHIRGVQQLGQSILQSPRRQRLFFVSSVSAISRCNGSIIDEAIYSDIDVAASTGYGQSKQISERILSEAAQHSALPVSVLRVGQIAGHDPGLALDASGSPDALPEWNANEWFPSVVKTAQSLGKIPQEFGKIDWIPVNVLSQIILEIVGSDIRHSQFKVYNLVNPRKSAWSTSYGAINSVLAKKADVIPLADWVKLLRGQAEESHSDLKKFPALKLLRFIDERLESMGKDRADYSVRNGVETSPTMAGLQPISEQDIQFWVAQWARSGKTP